MYEGLHHSGRRLHPLSPVLRGSRVILPAILVTAQATAKSGSTGVRLAVFLGLVTLVGVAGVISWLVTRWRVEAGTLRIETGLIRRDSRQIPLSRLQAIDIVRPLLGRVLGGPGEHREEDGAQLDPARP